MPKLLLYRNNQQPDPDRPDKALDKAPDFERWCDRHADSCEALLTYDTNTVIHKVIQPLLGVHNDLKPWE